MRGSSRAKLRLDVNRPGMLLDNDVIADREAEAGTFASCRGGIEDREPAR